jgi:hypothetical protein
MGSSAKKPCAGPNCPVLMSSGQRFCPKHAAKTKERINEGRRSDEVRKLYKRTFWIEFREWFLRKHPVCQRVIDGKRCLQPATVVHHMLSPRDRPDLFLDEDNCRAVCAPHHPTGQGAGPDEVYAVDNW